MNNESQKLIFGMSTHHNKQNKVTPNSRKPRLEKANRDQVVFKTVNVERLVEDNHPVRAIWEFVERLDLSSFYMRINAVEGVAGRRAIDPQTLISVWIYAYSKGIGSAREISKLCEYDPAFQWLTGMEVINHHTLSDFRINYKEALDDLFKQVLGLLSAENLITLERVMHDGTKIKANAGSDSFRREDKVRAHLKMAEEHIQNMADPTEESHGERSSKARQRAVRERKERLELALNELEKIRAKKPNQEAKHEARVSQTDPEARVMKQSNGGYGPSYNVQISTDRAKGIIVGVDATQEGNDCNQLLPAVEKVQENMGHEPHQMVADGGYTNRESIMAMKEKDVDFIGSMPTGSDVIAKCQLERRGIDPEFYPARFSYNPDENTLTCPAGKVLTCQGKGKRTGLVDYQYKANGADCMNCPSKDRCCPLSSEKGRIVMRRENHPVVEAFISKMNTPEAKEIYRQRGPTAEFPNAWIKEKMRLRQFHLRGLLKVRMECVWACLTYNIQQWIHLKWRIPQESMAIP